MEQSCEAGLPSPRSVAGESQVGPRSQVYSLDGSRSVLSRSQVGPRLVTSRSIGHRLVGDPGPKVVPGRSQVGPNSAQVRPRRIPGLSQTWFLFYSWFIQHAMSSRLVPCRSEVNSRSAPDPRSQMQCFVGRKLIPARSQIGPWLVPGRSQIPGLCYSGPMSAPGRTQMNLGLASGIS